MGCRHEVDLGQQRRLETIREGALMPDNIWLSNHMPNTRMSDKEYEANCKSLKKACDLQNECDAHSSLKKLKIISKHFKEILAQSDVISKDWKHQKKVHIGKYGYLG